jgi:hypothetical protein
MKRKNESDEKELVSKKAKQSDPENHDEGLGEDHDLERFRLANLPGADVLYIPDVINVRRFMRELYSNVNSARRPG